MHIFGVIYEKTLFNHGVDGVEGYLRFLWQKAQSGINHVHPRRKRFRVFDSSDAKGMLFMFDLFVSAALVALVLSPCLVASKLGRGSSQTTAGVADRQDPTLQ